jgi:hypothetical protein
MKQTRPAFVWFVMLFDINAQKIKTYDVLQYKETLIKKLKKTCSTKETFADTLKRELSWQYRSRAEYETLISVQDGRYYLEPWVGCKDEQYRIDVTENTTLDWISFAKEIFDKKGWNGCRAKIDVFDQLLFRFDEFIDFCWNYEHKYQRRKKED